MRVLAIGDVHGCFDALLALERAVGFLSDDLLIALGDYVDRGPDSAGVLDWMIQYGERGRLVALLGNHECMMLDARTDYLTREYWLTYGGEATLESYHRRGGEADLADVPKTHWEFLTEKCRIWYETESHFFVHANAVADLALDDQPTEILLWERLIDPLPHQNGKIMVCGHTPQSSGVPLNLGHAVCIDTWACGAGWLTCLDVGTGQFWQANQRGQSREGELTPPWPRAT